MKKHFILFQSSVWQPLVSYKITLINGAIDYNRSVHSLLVFLAFYSCLILEC